MTVMRGSPMLSLRSDGGTIAYQDDGVVEFDFRQTTPKLDPRVNFTRSSVAYYFDSSGVLKEAGIDVPRFDWGAPAPAHANPGLLVEGGQTNEALWNRDFTNAAWTKTSITAAKDQTGIDGVANSASRITASALNGTCLQAITSTSGARTFSCYVKRLVGSGNIDMTLDNGSTWTTVTVTANWTRVQITQTLANPTIGFRIVTSADSIAVDFAQEEKFANATSPILTTTVGVARNQDLVLVEGLNLSEGFSETGGTVSVQWYVTQADISAVERNILSIDDNTTNERIAFLQSNGSGITRATITDGGVSQAALLGAAGALNALHKAALRYGVNDFAAGLDAAAPNTDVAGTLPTVTQMRIGGRFNSTTSHLYGRVMLIKFYNAQMTNSQIQTETT